VSDDPPGVVHPQWAAWVAENLARGASRAEVVAALIEAGVPPEAARVSVEAIATSPALAHARVLARRVAALEQLLRLRREHRGARAAGSTTIERVPLPSADEFLARFWVPGVPVIFTDLVPRWPAFGRWGPRDFVARFGDVVVEACVGRTSSSDPDVLWKDLRRELTVAELVHELEAPATANDVYVTTNNAALRRPGLRALLDDIAVPEEIFGPSLDPARMGLWFGAAGTHTTMHHDHANAMLCQVLGRKRFRLVEPESLAMLEHSRGVYSSWDPRADDPAPGVLEVVLAPGQALFIPTGWWHQVDALDLAISVSIRKFAFPNDYGWYRPGTALAGRVPGAASWIDDPDDGSTA
jgi:hypothetical protein